ncbi:MAG: hypothetical protein WCN88_04965 [Candidatus Falkowbacteria bacterium]
MKKGSTKKTGSRRLTITLAPEAHKKLRIYVALNAKNLSETIDEIVNEHLTADNSKKTHKRGVK